LTGETASEPASTGDVTNRLVYSMLNEVVHAMDEGVIHLPRVADMGAIYGLGFPPFRGGPLRYIDSLGAARVSNALEELRERHGDRFAPAEGLVRMAERNDTFYEQPLATEN
jgi:3-hydroxyacyl-CoA dehydrogenase/enoyl-CoA hydratase/3-hydroxybutyryl-CoA epimerase